MSQHNRSQAAQCTIENQHTQKQSTINKQLTEVNTEYNQQTQKPQPTNIQS